jgi:hypothetical protein
MVVIAAFILSASFIGGCGLLYKGLIAVSNILLAGEEAKFVSLDSILAEQYPEQYTNLPEDMLLEDDFSLLK